MGSFVLRNVSAQYRTVSRCVRILKSGPFRIDASKFHTYLRDFSKFRKPGFSIFSSASTGRPIEGLSVYFKTNESNCFSIRFMATRPKKQHNNTVWYFMAAVITMVGMSYAGVPLYKIFCSRMGLGGDPELARAKNVERVVDMQKIPDRKITVKFSADRDSSLRWNFVPQQTEIKLSPGETALAFYTAKNPTDEPIIGVATYAVAPFEAALYFHKIQCFCFEEQILNPHEQVDMPVFFYIDPDFDTDPALEGEDIIVLSYTFFEAKEGEPLPLPGYNQTLKQPS